MTSYPSSSPTPCQELAVEVFVTTDQYPSETTWELESLCGTGLKESGGPYNKEETLFTASFCLPYGVYSFTIRDLYGDGKSKTCKTHQGLSFCYPIRFHVILPLTFSIHFNIKGICCAYGQVSASHSAEDGCICPFPGAHVRSKFSFLYTSLHCHCGGDDSVNLTTGLNRVIMNYMQMAN